MKVELDLPDWIAAALLRWSVPADLCGASLAERLEFTAMVTADGVLIAEERAKTKALYRALGVPHKDDFEDEDDIPL